MADETSSRRAVATRWAPLLAALVFLVGINLRPAVTSVGPVLPRIGSDLGLSEPVQGLLGSLPVLAFAVGSPLVHRLTRRTGVDGALLLALVLIAAGIALRSFTGLPGLWIGTVVAGLAIAIGNVLVPVVVRRDYRTRVAAATGVFTMFLTLGAATASGTAVPLAEAWGWRGGLAFWAIPPLVIGVVWALRIRVSPSPPSPLPQPGEPTTSVWRQPTAWLVTAFMGLQSTAFYVLVTWLPTIEAAAGVPETTAGVHLSIYQLIGTVSGMTIPLLMRRRGSVVRAAVTASVPMVVAVVGMLTFPNLPVLWVLVAGLSSGASLVVALTLIGLRGRSHAETTQLSGMAQAVGYSLAAAGPVAAGWLAQVSGAWRAPLVMVAVLACLQTLAAVLAGRDRPAPVPALDRSD
ncbi:CynX/NimT family MFS transporter [Pseudactinotalea suaedae]|uniref:CynX/NimT family MFS transporter n=1 Tax=Pseudactinotalea suaedae TaxID=1524924 RepID=UPI0012E18260|nr:MFS transporter [Pseudactinotalea suaedae]